MKTSEKIGFQRISAADRQRLAARGGKVTAVDSKKKAAALKRLHTRRRGKRMHPDTRGRESVLAAVHTALGSPTPGLVSKRAVAAHCGVSDRTLRRWLSGEDWPPATQLARLASWARKHA